MRDKDFPRSPKWLTVQQLTSLLQRELAAGRLLPEHRLIPNGVGNLAVVSAEDDSFVGFIDFFFDGELKVELPG